MVIIIKGMKSIIQVSIDRWLAMVDETKLMHTKLCTGLQGFVLFDSG